MNANVLVLLSNLNKLLLHQDILFVDVREDKINLRLVASLAAANDSIDNLNHGRNTSATSDHTNVSAHVGRVNHRTLGSANLHLLSDSHLLQVLRDVTLRVRLDEQIEVALVLIGRDGRVRAKNLLGLSFNGRGESDVLADGKAEDIGGLGQTEAVDGDVVRASRLLNELKVLEFRWLQDLAGLCGEVLSVNC